MILVAATALGCGAHPLLDPDLDGEARWRALGDVRGELFQQAPGASWAEVGELSLELTIEIAWLGMPVIAMWTLALIPIRLLGPRPSRRRLARQPGLMATLAVGVATVFGGLQYLIGASVWGWDYYGGMIGTEDTMAIVPALFGLAVSVSWMTLCVGRRWRAEASWVDRLGRAMGAFWIMAGFAVTGLFLEGAKASSCAITVRAINPAPAAAAEAESTDVAPK